MRRLIIFKSLFTLKKSLALFISFLFIQHITAQLKVEGYVRSTDGKALSDINIKSEPAGNTTETDQQGHFQISLNNSIKNHSLIFSGIGYRDLSVRLNSDSIPKLPLNIELVVDVLKLDEVVVTGNAINTTKKKLGNAISTIQGADVKYTGTNHLSGLLNGRIMGGVVMQNSGDPGGGFSLKLRGVGSVFGSSEPLYLVDGVIVDNGSQNMVNLNIASPNRFQTGNNRIIDINPHDIENIEVINGAAAAAIYGSRAANGVVQIFTRKGKKGKPEVTFTSSINYNTPGRRIEVNEYPFRFGIKQNARIDTLGDNRTMLFQNRPDKATNPGNGPVSFTGALDTTRYPVKRYDYQDLILNPSWGTDQHLAVSGGGNNGNYYFSGSYLDNGGIMVGTGFRRYGMKMSSAYQLNDWIKMGGGLMYTNSRSEEKPNSFLQFSPLGAMNHTDNVYNIEERDADGNLKKVEHSWYNPLSSVETHELSTETNRILANININLSPWKGFNFSGIFGMDSYSQQGNNYQARVPYKDVSGTLYPDGYVSLTKLNYQQWTTDISASYSRDLGPSFTSATVAGYAGQYISNNYFAQEGRNLVPFIRTIKSAQTLSAPVDQRSEQTIWGYFLQETLGYKKFLYLTLAGRFDGSSAFGAEAGTIFYPKAGLTFTLSDLDFWKNSAVSSWFNTIHLRASYGKAGNLTGIGPYDRFTTLQPIVYYNNVGGLVPLNRKGNEDIRPEIKTEWEAGADIQFLKGRLFSRFTFYHQQIEDMVIPLNWAPSNGNYSILGNLGSMENRGFEFMAGGYPVKGNDFSWEVSFLFNRNKNKVTSLSTNTNYIGFEGVNQGAAVGYPVGSYYSNYFARNTDGSLILTDVNGYKLPQAERGDPIKNQPQRVDGQPVGTPINKILGDPNPDYTSTLVNDLRYKNWKFRIQVDRVAGMEMFNATKIIRNNIGNGKMAEQEVRGELTRGWVGAIGGLITGPVIWESAVDDASFTKIREVSLSYQLNGLKWIKGIEFILAGRNLFTFTSYDGFDPETNVTGQSYIRGIDYGNYPIPRVIQFSIFAKF